MISPATHSNPDDHPIERASTTEGLPVSPSLGPALELANVPSRTATVDRRTIFVCLLILSLALLVLQGVFLFSHTNRQSMMIAPFLLLFSSVVFGLLSALRHLAFRLVTLPWAPADCA